LPAVVTKRTRERAGELIFGVLAFLAIGVVLVTDHPLLLRVGVGTALLVGFVLVWLFREHDAMPAVSMGVTVATCWMLYHPDGDPFFLVMGLLCVVIFLYRLARYREGTIFLPSD
jgi:hypothetical protein